ncbi:MAG: 4-hydroxythreonine-4-phosphate dehydrogenase PdxA [Desulfobulbus sp.]|nr:4-hydroxythreonine-4-phosphate dehydrogenase PdxA [Desulfobulbus sp.]
METLAQSVPQPVAITMGCPASIGPEIICRLFAQQSSAVVNSVVLGDIGVLTLAAALLGVSLAIVSWSPGEMIIPGSLPVVQVGESLPLPIRWGAPDAATGKAMGRYIEKAVELIQQGTCSALVTCPISKKSLQEAGYTYPGHTEMLAALTGNTNVRMMLAGPTLRVVLVTIHVALSRVSELLTTEEIIDCIQTTSLSLQRDFGIARPRIAVAALNPHAGEEGLFGDEENRLIVPALKRAGIKAELSGPWPPDTIFHKAAGGQFDAVICMYHDQGLIPFKLLHFADGVNVTLGLPIVRTSVDHGTAYDIAGTNQADPFSLQAALLMAQSIVVHRRQWRQG